MVPAISPTYIAASLTFTNQKITLKPSGGDTKINHADSWVLSCTNMDGPGLQLLR